jgi:NAD(P)-dependent dehydrogenase (short-subunit alcohol dehydrogenase family)
MIKPMQKKVVMITGAAGALGSEIAMRCAKLAWIPILLDKNRRGLEQLYDRIVQEAGAEPFLIVQDMATLSPQDCEDIVNALELGPQRLDALVHCAATFEGLQPLEQIQPDHWLNQIQVSINAPWLLSVSCLPLLRLSPEASIYFISEDIEKLRGAYWGAYGVGKHGAHALASQFAAELSNTSIHVLSLNPGPMKSELRAKAHHSEPPNLAADPGVAAEKIVQLLGRKLNALSWQVNLNELGS